MVSGPNIGCKMVVPCISRKWETPRGINDFSKVVWCCGIFRAMSEKDDLEEFYHLLARYGLIAVSYTRLVSGLAWWGPLYVYLGRGLGDTNVKGGKLTFAPGF